MATAQKIAVVTGSNRGIGLAAVKALLKRNPSWIVYLTARDKERGIEAVQQVCKETDLLPAFHELDINSATSIGSFYDYLRRNHKRIDVLVNNAGIFPKQNQILRIDENSPSWHLHRGVFAYETKTVRSIVNTNYFGTLDVCKVLIPLLSNDARVVNVTSSLSQVAFNQFTPTVQDAVRRCRTVDDVSALINSFLALPPTHYVKNGWLSKLYDDSGFFYGDIVPYGLSKIGVNLITQIFQRQLDAELKDSPQKCILINACSPGSVKTDSNPHGLKSVDEAGETLAALANLPRDSALRGRFVHERRVEDPFTGVAISNH